MTDNELIKKFEEHVEELERLEQAGSTKRFFIGKKTLMWRGILKEVKNRTAAGVRYMKAMKKIFERQADDTKRTARD